MSTPPTESSDQTESPYNSSLTDEVGRRIERLEKEEPLRPRILDLLAGHDLTPTDLADELGVRKESVSRLLKAFREEGLVEVRRVLGDRRQRRYVLTSAGEIELRRHRSYGDPGPPPIEPDREETIRFLFSGLARSVELRRYDNQLEAAIDRQRKILNQARKLNAGELAVEAIHELATTLRLSGQETQVGELLEDLNEVALGRTGYSGTGLSLQASAHRSYALGRRGESKPARQGQRMNLLITATTNYCELAQGSTSATSRKWRERQAWSAYSLAANMRSVSRLDDALRIAVSAQELFEKIEDSYGKAHCLFLIGFCFRLMGDFNAALKWLDRAHTLAVEGSYTRLQVDSLMQVGEVHRCRGELDEARMMLEESRNRAEQMKLLVTQAFAHSALGSVAFGQGRWIDAQSELCQAEERFKAAPHWEGQALNARRLAIAARLVFEKTPDGDLRLARRLNEEAESRYRDPNRPAGVVACSIEHDRLRMCEGRPPDTIDNLLDLIENRDSERECLELDPWVPPLLVDFAEKTENETLVETAQRVLVAATQRRKESLARAMEIVGGGSVTADEPDQLEVSEMGGETRLEGSLAPSPVLVTA